MIFLFLLVVSVSKQIEFHVSHLCNFRDDEFEELEGSLVSKTFLHEVCAELCHNFILHHYLKQVVNQGRDLQYSLFSVSSVLIPRMPFYN